MAKEKKQKHEINRHTWLKRLKEAETFQKEWKHRANRFKGYLEGKSEKPIASGHIVVNTLFKDLKTSIPSVFAKNPDVLAQPAIKTDLAKLMARVAKQVLPYYYKELRLKRAINRCLVDVKVAGQGFIKLGFDFEMAQQEVDPDTWKDLSQENQDFLMTLDMNKDKEPGKHIIQEQISKNDPWALRWSPWEMVTDPEATSPDLTDARWVAFRKLLPKREAETMIGSAVASDVPVKVREGVSKTLAKHSDFQKLTLWEVHDRMHKERVLFFEEVDWELREPLEDLDGFWG